MIVYYIINVLSWLIWLYCLLIVIDAIMSWLPFLANSSVGQFLNRIVDPYLDLFRRGPIRRLAYSTGIDISAVIGIFILYFIQNDVFRWILNLVFR